MDHVEASGNGGYGLRIGATAGNNAKVTVTDSCFSNNGLTGFVADLVGLDGEVAITASNIYANGNGGYGVEWELIAAGSGNDAISILRDSNLSGNTAGSYTNLVVAVDGGNTVNIVENVIE